MVTQAQIEEIGRHIGERFRPGRVVLFGSHAWGSPRDDSDVDLLVIMDHGGSSLAQAAAVARTIRAPFDVDVVVRTPAEIRRRLEWGDGFLRSIVESGKVLYEASDR